MPDADKSTPRPWTSHGPVTGPRATAGIWLEGDDDGSGFRYDRHYVVAGRRLVAIVPGGEGDPVADRDLIIRCVNAHAALVALARRVDGPIRGLLERLARDSEQTASMAADCYLLLDEATEALKLAEAP